MYVCMLNVVLGGKYNACLRYARRFAHPIHRVMYCDITGDGVNELIVLSTAGVHVLQVMSLYYIMFTNLYINS